MTRTISKQKKLSDMDKTERYSRQFSSAEEPIIPELELEWFQPPQPQPHEEPGSRTGSVRFGWIGSGQCGGRLAETFYQLGYPKVLAVNTTTKDLRPLDLPEEQKFLMKIGKGGAGKNMARGREAAERYGSDLFSRVEEVFGEEADHLMICFGAGGGTGGGSALGLIELAQNYARLLRFRKPHQQVGVLMTLPSACEIRSKQVASNAHAAALELTQLAEENRISPLILVDNDKIEQICPGLTVKEYWPTVNRRVGELFDTFNRLSAYPSPYTSFDPMDYSQVLTAGGCTVMGLTEVEQIQDKYAVSRAIRKNLETTLLASDYDLCKAKAAASVVVGGRRMMAQAAGLQDNINYGFDMLAAVTGRAVVHRGIYEDDVERLRVYTMISGLPAPQRRLKRLK